ncbi:MAG: polysaccharide biosynthesis C-terminal domain-containing protein, partial [Chitinophagales bacterium]|nr:polysaccharide biosynthesis C-terminal domain-containing protein [Chitinophagales bacterium]
FPFALLTFLMTVYYRIDAVMIERMLGEQGEIQAGIYASGYRLLDACNILGFMFAALLLPMFSRMLEQKNAIKPLLDLSHNIMWICAVIGGITFLFYRREITQLLYVEADAYYAEVFGWLMVSFICISMVYIYGTLLTANGSLKILNKIALGGMIMNILLNLFLIPKYKATGAAMATVITQVFVLGVHILYAYKMLLLPFDKMKWVIGFIYLILVIATCFLLRQSSVMWYWEMAICFAAGLGAAFLLKMITWKNIVDTARLYIPRQ